MPTFQEGKEKNMFTVNIGLDDGLGERKRKLESGSRRVTWQEIIKKGIQVLEIEKSFSEECPDDSDNQV